MMRLILLIICSFPIWANSQFEVDLKSVSSVSYSNYRMMDLEPAKENCQGVDFNIFTYDPIVTPKIMKVEYRIYRPTHKKRQDSIIMYPPTGGANFIDETFAEKFCKAGFSTLIIESWPGSQFDGLVAMKAYDQSLVRGYHATRHAIDILGTKVGVFGMSLGGISALSAGILLPKDVKAVSVVAAALPFHKIIAYSDEKNMKLNRESRMKQHKLNSLVEYQNLLRKNIKIEPLNYVDEKIKTPHQFIISDDDDYVQTYFQNKTLELYSNKTATHISWGHVGTLLSAYMYDKDEITMFFEDNLY